MFIYKKLFDIIYKNLKTGAIYEIINFKVKEEKIKLKENNIN